MSLVANTQTSAHNQADDNAISQAVPIAAPLGTEQRLRAGAWSLLASLLYSAPPQDLLDHLGMHDASGNAAASDDTAAALQALADAAITSKPDALAESFQELFIGVGRGELVPYGSFYQTGFLMEKPLAVLRSDLRELGFERQDDIAEPEDHIAALCEVMSLLITDGVKHETQQQFYEKHLAPWVGRFFEDLRQANAAVPFYQAVGQFGNAFINLETQYFAMKV